MEVLSLLRYFTTAKVILVLIRSGLLYAWQIDLPGLISGMVLNRTVLKGVHHIVYTLPSRVGVGPAMVHLRSQTPKEKAKKKHAASKELLKHKGKNSFEM